ncbi:MAG: hypothetical protein ACRDV9_07415, partial [Acidimicrobiia bacterium]
QHQGTAHLLLARFESLLLFRLAAAACGLGLVAWVLASPGPGITGRLAVAAILVGLGELAGRYLFYVTVVSYRPSGTSLGQRR